MVDDSSVYMARRNAFKPLKKANSKDIKKMEVSTNETAYDAPAPEPEPYKHDFSKLKGKKGLGGAIGGLGGLVAGAAVAGALPVTIPGAGMIGYAMAVVGSSVFANNDLMKKLAKRKKLKKPSTTAPLYAALRQYA